MRTPSAWRSRRWPSSNSRLGREDDVGGFLAHLLFDQRHGHARRVAAKRLEAFQQRPLEGAEKAGNALHVEDVDELVDGALGDVGAKRLVGNLDQRGFVLRVPQHAIQFGLLPPLGRSLQLGGALADGPRQTAAFWMVSLTPAAGFGGSQRGRFPRIGLLAWGLPI